MLDASKKRERVMFMKKKLLSLGMACACTVLATGCAKQENNETKLPNNDSVVAAKDGVYAGKGNGYHGELELSVTFEDNQIKDIEVVSDHETSVIINRAFPLLKERILEQQTAQVDTVSGATFTSFAVKTAVAEAAKEAGIDYGTISFLQPQEELARVDLEDVTTQIVIVGGGPAGLSAAIEAKEAGVEDVLVIEKMDILSGNGKFDMNFYDMIDSQAQRDAGIEDSPELYIEEKKDIVWDTIERLEAQAYGAAELDEWLRDMGVELNYTYSSRGHMASATSYAGEAIQDGLEAKVKELGIEVRTGTKGYDFITEDGKIRGVKVQHGNEFYNIKADAVIMATGGFSANKDLLKEYAPGHEALETSNQIGATGDFVNVFEEHNFALDHMDEMRVFPLILQGSRHLTGGSDNGFILVNEDGERFVDETLGGLAMAEAILAQKDKKVYYIYDQRLLDGSYRLQKHTSEGWHATGSSIEDLAQQLGINADNLKNSVETYNAAVNGECDDPVRETAFTTPMDLNGNFYGGLVESAIHMTKGGVLANEKAEVLDTDGNVVEGVYAAGEVAASSASYSAAVVFGRISGQEAARYVLNK